MSATRDRVRMDEAGLAALWRENLKLQVATIGPTGAPHLSTLFYALHGECPAFWTYGASQKIRNLERDPRLSALVEDGVAYDELRGASITGRAQIVRDPDLVLGIGCKIVARMSGLGNVEDLGEEGVALVRQQAGKRVAVVVHADHVATWDHRLLRDAGR